MIGKAKNTTDKTLKIIALTNCLIAKPIIAEPFIVHKTVADVLKIRTSAA